MRFQGARDPRSAISVVSLSSYHPKVAKYHILIPARKGKSGAQKGAFPPFKDTAQKFPHPPLYMRPVTQPQKASHRAGGETQPNAQQKAEGPVIPENGRMGFGEQLTLSSTGL